MIRQNTGTVRRTTPLKSLARHPIETMKKSHCRCAYCGSDPALTPSLSKCVVNTPTYVVHAKTHKCFILYHVSPDKRLDKKQFRLRGLTEPYENFDSLQACADTCLDASGNRSKSAVTRQFTCKFICNNVWCDVPLQSIHEFRDGGMLSPYLHEPTQQSVSSHPLPSCYTRFVTLEDDDDTPHVPCAQNKRRKLDAHSDKPTEIAPVARSNSSCGGGGGDENKTDPNHDLNEWSPCEDAGTWTRENMETFLSKCDHAENLPELTHIHEVVVNHCILFTCMFVHPRDPARALISVKLPYSSLIQHEPYKQSIKSFYTETKEKSPLKSSGRHMPNCSSLRFKKL